MKEIADSIGIYGEDEVLEALRFLNDLGSIQYFENNALKDRVIINPQVSGFKKPIWFSVCYYGNSNFVPFRYMGGKQWIVDAFSKVISVKETCIEEGRLKHVDLTRIWSAYDSSLHDWMLKLTEAFDLTFAVPEKFMSIVPCLLPDQQPSFEWPQLDQLDDLDTAVVKLKEYHVIYTFEYLPAGLFNRIQVRLFNYADSSHMWSSGSILQKNNQLALMTQSRKVSEIRIKVQGVKPENIVFVIHEVCLNFDFLFYFR